MTAAGMKRRKSAGMLSPRARAGRGDRGSDIERSIYEEIHRAISDRRLPPGTKLVEEHLAEAFGVSRARSRSVLQSLAREKVVTLEPNRGAFVSHPSPAEARQVFEARRVLEVGLAEAVVGGVTKKALERLRKHVRLEELTEHGPDRHRDLKNSHDFHMLLAQLANNSVLEAFLAELLARSALITAIYERSDGLLCSHASHRKLIDVLEDRDPQAYIEAMQLHLEEVEANLDLVEPETTGSVDLRRLFRSRWQTRA